METVRGPTTLNSRRTSVGDHLQRLRTGAVSNPTVCAAGRMFGYPGGFIEKRNWKKESKKAQTLRCGQTGDIARVNLGRGNDPVPHREGTGEVERKTSRDILLKGLFNRPISGTLRDKNCKGV